MTDGGTVRIGTAERTEAMKALDQHLSDGRLGVNEYADRSAVAANATVAEELRGLFTDLPAPHPVLPGDPTALPVAATGSTAAVSSSGAVAQRQGGFMEVAAPRIMAVMPIVALALFFTIGGWWWFLLIPAAGAVLYGSEHGHNRDRDQRRRERRARRGDGH